MASVNKVIIIGNLGRDPEVRYTESGSAIANLNVATTFSWKDKGSGEKREETEWHRVSLFGRTAEVAGEYLRKGSQVYIEGRLRTRKWEKDRVERYTTEIVGEQLTMLGGKGDEGDSKPQADAKAYSNARNGIAPTQSIDELDEDVPF